MMKRLGVGYRKHREVSWGVERIVICPFRPTLGEINRCAWMVDANQVTFVKIGQPYRGLSAETVVGEPITIIGTP